MHYLVVVVMMFFAVGCQTASRVVSYTQNNPVIVNFATKQAIARYIQAGQSADDVSHRADRVVTVIREVEYFLDGNPTASSDTLFDVVKSNVELDRLSVTDRLLVDDLFALVQENLKKNEQAGFLPADAVIRIRVLLRTLLQTAALF